MLNRASYAFYIFPCCQGQYYHSKFFTQVYFVCLNVINLISFCAISFPAKKQENFDLAVMYWARFQTQTKSQKHLSKKPSPEISTNFTSVEFSMRKTIVFQVETNIINDQKENMILIGLSTFAIFYNAKPQNKFC